MQEPKKEHPEVKTKLHPRNRHRSRYDLTLLSENYPALKVFVAKNKFGDWSIDFFNSEAVLALNKAILKTDYGIEHWEIPDGYLCPPIPGRADYMHHVADLLADSNNGEIPKGDEIKCLDIGTGANCIYPIIGHHEYGWSFIASEVDSIALDAAKSIVRSNSNLANVIECRLQSNPNETFSGIIKPSERIDISICNPPFHASKAEAESVALRKLRNLKGQRVSKASLNFGGRSNELWTDGGEKAFILKMIKQSAAFDKRCLWFTTLVSKHENLKPLQIALKKSRATTYKTIQMGQGNKVSRILAWTYLSYTERKNWSSKS